MFRQYFTHILAQNISYETYDNSNRIHREDTINRFLFKSRHINKQRQTSRDILPISITGESQPYHWKSSNDAICTQSSFIMLGVITLPISVQMKAITAGSGYTLWYIFIGILALLLYSFIKWKQQFHQAEDIGKISLEAETTPEEHAEEALVTDFSKRDYPGFLYQLNNIEQTIVHRMVLNAQQQQKSTIEQLNTYLGTSNKSPAIQKNTRHIALKNINTQYITYFGRTNKLIVNAQMTADKRQFEYYLSEIEKEVWQKWDKVI